MSVSPGYFQDAMVRIRQAIAGYHEGLLRIDREFDAACDRIVQSLSDLHVHAAKHHKQVGEADLQRLEQERRQLNANREKRKQNWQSVFAREWDKRSAEITRADLLLRQHQPAFMDFGPDSPRMAMEVPDRLLLGSQQVSFETFSCLIPHIIQFPLSHALMLTEYSMLQTNLVHHFLLRLLSALPPGHLELTLIDPLQLGQSVEPFLPLLKVEQLIPQQRVLTRSDEIEAALGKLVDQVEQLIQYRFNDKAPNWQEHNVNNPANPLSYKVVVLFNVPEQLSDKSLWFLERLCESGPRCGILPVIAVDYPRMEDRRYEKIRTTLDASAIHLDVLLQGAHAGCSDLSFKYQPDNWPRKDGLDGFIGLLAAAYAAKGRFSKLMPDLWADVMPDATTIDGFDIPIGWTSSGEMISLKLGATDSEHHVLLAGKTGSGKSNLLHIMIHSLCQRYSPGEVDLYLLDYKESTEFSIYATPPLPHARLVATESDPEYGVTVLRYLVCELEARARTFKDTGVRDFAEYRKATGQQLTRILLVVDEFQILFAEKRQIAESAEQLLSQLLKQGRSFGIHILLATQTLKGITAQSIGSLITQLGCRIALACGQEDSAMILSGNNWAAAELRSPPEGIINNANGAKSGNVTFLIPLADSISCREHIACLSESVKSPSKTRVFSGANLPEAPSSSQYQAVCGQANALLLGEQLTFNADVLVVPLSRRAALNVLFSGYNDQIHDGLLATILSSMAFASGFDDVVYFNGRGIAPGGGFSALRHKLAASFRMFDDIGMLPLQTIVDDIGVRRVALIIDGLDAEKALHPASAFRAPKPGEPVSPADLLKRIAEEGPRKGTFVFAFVDRWQRCAGVCKDLFSFFELRVAYCMNEDDAGALVSGGIGKFKGVEKPNRAVFVNRMTNDIVWFRPYIQGDSA